MDWLKPGNTRIPPHSICELRGDDWFGVVAMWVPFRNKTNKGRWVTLRGNIMRRCDPSEYKIIKVLGI